MAQGNVLEQQGAGAKINGIWNDYVVASGGEVSANGFVKYIIDISTNTQGNDTQINSYDSNEYSNAVALDLSRVLIIYNAYISGNYKHYAVVCTINNLAITVGTPTYLNTPNNGNPSDTVLLDENKVFVFYNSSNYISQLLLTINNDTITITTSARSSTGYSPVSIAKLDNNTVFACHRRYASSSSSRNITATLYKISNSTITEYTSSINISSTYNVKSCKVIALSDTKVVMFYGTKSCICTISGTTITAGTNTGVPNQDDILDAKLLTEDTILAVSAGSSSSYVIYSVLFKVSGTTITDIDSNNQLPYTIANAKNIKLEKINNNKFIIIYAAQDNYKLSYIPININNNVIVPATSVLILSTTKTGLYIATVLLNNKLFIQHSYEVSSKDYVYCILLQFSEYVNKLTSNSDEIFGIAKSNAIAGETVQVCTPNISN